MVSVLPRSAGRKVRTAMQNQREHRLEAAMHVQFDKSSSTIPAAPCTSSTEAMTGQMILGLLQQMLDVQKAASHEIINIQREQLYHARARRAENLNRLRTVLSRWAEH